MKKLVLVLALLGVIGCAPSKEVVDVINGKDGKDGKDGVSCTASSTEGGILLNCGEESAVFLSNGQDGADGQDGVDGQDGMDGQDGADGEDGQPGPKLGSLSEITLNGCTLIESGLYGKLQGSGSLKLYSNSSCSGSGVGTLSSTDEIYVLSGGNLLLFQSNDNVLFKLIFN